MSFRQVPLTPFASVYLYILLDFAAGPSAILLIIVTLSLESDDVGCCVAWHATLNYSQQCLT